MLGIRQATGALFTIVVLLLLGNSPDSEASSGRTYRVHGQVVAVNVGHTPHMIVVRTPLGKHDDMTVEAKVTTQTKIMRKKALVALQTIKVGESVWLTYVKQRDGVFARSIQVP